VGLGISKELPERGGSAGRRFKPVKLVNRSGPCPRRESIGPSDRSLKMGERKGCAGRKWPIKWDTDNPECVY